MTIDKMGSLEWGDANGGRLDSDEVVKLARNYAGMRAEMVFDEARHRLGILDPRPVDLSSLAPPDTKLVRDADDLARSVYNDVLWFHCLRPYYFGALVAAHDGIEFDREIFYAAAICHDAGVNEDGAGPVQACCFAHSGGTWTFEELSKRGHGEAAFRVGDAISTHMNLIVPEGRYPAENTLVAVGATCDIFGAYVRRIAKPTLAETVAMAPRDGLFEAFGPFLAKAHLDNSRTELLVKMGAFDGDGEHPIERTLSEG